MSRVLVGLAPNSWQLHELRGFVNLWDPILAASGHLLHSSDVFVSRLQTATVQHRAYISVGPLAVLSVRE